MYSSSSYKVMNCVVERTTQVLQELRRSSHVVFKRRLSPIRLFVWRRGTGSLAVIKPDLSRNLVVLAAAVNYPASRN